MTYKLARAPHLRRTDSAAMMNVDVLIALVPLSIFSAVYYGFRPVLLMAVSIVTAVLCETLGCLMMKRRPTVTDGSAVVTGAIVGALMSPVSPYWLPVVASAFAILVAKMPMGGNGRNLFNPAAAGLAVVTLCFPGHLFTYPDPGLGVPLSLNGTLSGIVTEVSPAAQLAGGGKTLYTPMTLFLGDFPGPIGATAIALVIACGLFLYSRKVISGWITLPYLATCALLALIVPRVNGGTAGSVMVELCAGYLLFGGIFLLNDPVTAPRHWLGRVAYGVFAGLFVMLLRYFGRFEEGVCFAVLLVNAFVPTLDRMGWYLLNLRRIRKGGNAS